MRLGRCPFEERPAVSAVTPREAGAEIPPEGEPAITGAGPDLAEVLE